MSASILAVTLIIGIRTDITATTITAAARIDTTIIVTGGGTTIRIQYYFTAPKVRPRTSCFWVSQPSTMIGATDSSVGQKIRSGE